MDISVFKDKFIELFGKDNTLVITDDTSSDIYPKYYQAFPINWTKAIHYELIQESANGPVFLEFHIERSHYWEFEDLPSKYTEIFNRPENKRDCCSRTYHSSCFWKMRRPITREEDFATDAERLIQIVQSLTGGKAESHVSNKDEVCIESQSADKLLEMPLSIPAFQRGYCWRKKDVVGFLDSISRWQQENANRNYHMGIVVLRKNDNNEWDIIDGLQRITTLSILSLLMGNNPQPYLMSKELKAPYNTPEAQNCLLHARDAIKEWRGTIDLGRLECGVIELDSSTSPDLAYSFFNHINSSGVKLSDYDLIKSHHLRFVRGDAMSERMATAWDGDSENDGIRALVLHNMLFRLRKWTSDEEFDSASDNLPTHVLFHHFECKHPQIPGLSEDIRFEQFDSTVHGGIPFFSYYQFYKNTYLEFCKKKAVIAMKTRLSNHSKNFLCNGIEALAYLFYIRFGDLYLNEAIYCLAFHISQLRNRRNIDIRMWSWRDQNRIFRETATLIAHAGNANDVIAELVDEKN